MRLMVAVAIAGLLIGPAYGQSGPSSNPAIGVPVGSPSKNREEKQKLDPKEVDAAYQATMKRLTPGKAVSDPWQKVRTPRACLRLRNRNLGPYCFGPD
jgi:hypothetical protein